MKKITILLLYILTTGVVEASKANSSQCSESVISGSRASCIGQAKTYTYTGSSRRFIWSISGGGTFDSYATGNSTFVVTWAVLGTHKVYFNDLDSFNGSCEANVSVYDAEGGTLTPANNTVCKEGGTTLTLSGISGSITRWERSTNNGVNWSPIAHTGTEYSPSNIQVRTQYRVLVTEAICGVTVHPILVQQSLREATCL